jgi:hypothetical protein
MLQSSLYLTPLIPKYASTVLHPPKNCPTNADTGCTGHYMAISDAEFLINLQPTTAPLTVTMPDGSVSVSIHTAELNLPCLPRGARNVDVFPNFINSLLFIGVLCDHGLTATYTATSVIISDNVKVVLTGTRSQSTRLWMIDICRGTYTVFCIGRS